MNCEQIQEHLADYLGNELDSEKRATFQTHLAMCEKCGPEVASLTNTIDVLQRLDSPRLDTGVSPRSRGGKWRVSSYAAVLLLGLGLGWWIKPAESRPLPFGVHRSWIEAAVASSGGSTGDPFARNAVRLVRALSGGRR